MCKIQTRCKVIVLHQKLSVELMMWDHVLVLPTKSFLYLIF